MTNTSIKPKQYALGMQFGKESANYAFVAYPDVVKNAEVEMDLIEIMAELWIQAEPLIATICGNEKDMKIVRKGWSNGFLDGIFPLRHYT